MFGCLGLGLSRLGVQVKPCLGWLRSFHLTSQQDDFSTEQESVWGVKQLSIFLDGNLQPVSYTRSIFLNQTSAEPALQGHQFFLKLMFFLPCLPFLTPSLAAHVTSWPVRENDSVGHLPA